MTLEIIAADGRRRPMEAVSVPISQPDGLFLHLALFRDLSERARFERQIRQAQRMEVMGRLAGGVAHDFNNLLTVINGYSEMVLQRLPEVDPLRGLLTEISQAGNRASLLTKQLLTFSRRQHLEVKPLDLRVILMDIEKLLVRLVGEDIAFTVSVAPEVDAIKADLGQIHQILLNLAVNARDAMPEGGELRIEADNVELSPESRVVGAAPTPGKYVRITVADTGCGMDAGTADRIFEPFFTTKGPTQGTGLGLATVFDIVRGCRGYIAVATEVGVGTTFRVYLPRFSDPQSVGDSVVCAPARKQGSEVILLVEDDESVRTLMALTLESHGFRVLVAGCPEDAVRFAEAADAHIDLVAADVVLPRMDGRLLSETIRDRFPNVKVLHLSGYPDEVLERHGIERSRMNFLEKPYPPSRLVAKVREMLDG